MSTAWVAVIGSLGGVLIGGVLNIAMERLRDRRAEHEWQRERRERLQERRRQLSAEMLARLFEVYSRTWSYSDYREHQPNWRQDAYVQAQQDRLEEAAAAFRRAYYELALVGVPPQVVAAATELFRWNSHLLSQGFRPLGGDEPPKLDIDNDLWAEEIDAFLEAAQSQFAEQVEETTTT